MRIWILLFLSYKHYFSTDLHNLFFESGSCHSACQLSKPGMLFGWKPVNSLFFFPLLYKTLITAHIVELHHIPTSVLYKCLIFFTQVVFLKIQEKSLPITSLGGSQWMELTRHVEAVMSHSILRNLKPQNLPKLPPAPKRGPSFLQHKIYSGVKLNITQLITWISIQERIRGNREIQTTKIVSTLHCTDMNIPTCWILPEEKGNVLFKINWWIQ